MYPGSIGFPTRRKKERGNYIASNNSTMWFKCPEKCRRQPEWTYCWAHVSFEEYILDFCVEVKFFCSRWWKKCQLYVCTHGPFNPQIFFWNRCANNSKLKEDLSESCGTTRTPSGSFFAEVKTLCYDWDQFARESKAAWQLCSWRSSWHCFTSCYGQIMMSIQQKEIKFSRV